MPVRINKDGGITEDHTAKRVQIELESEDVESFNLEIYFSVDPQLNGASVAPAYLDTSHPLKITCKNNQRLRDALLVIQDEIGIARYAQATAPEPEPIPLGPLAVSPE